MALYGHRVASLVATGISASLCIFAAAVCEGRPPHTFLDTLNKGREVCITAADVAVPAAPAAVAPPPSPAASAPHFAIQVAAVKGRTEAMNRKAALEPQIDSSVTVIYEAHWYKLLVGDFPDRDSAKRYLVTLKDRGYNDAWVVPFSGSR